MEHQQVQRLSQQHWERGQITNLNESRSESQPIREELRKALNQSQAAIWLLRRPRPVNVAGYLKNSNYLCYCCSLSYCYRAPALKLPQRSSGRT